MPDTPRTPCRPFSSFMADLKIRRADQRFDPWIHPAARVLSFCSASIFIHLGISSGPRSRLIDYSYRRLDDDDDDNVIHDTHTRGPGFTSERAPHRIVGSTAVTTISLYDHSTTAINLLLLLLFRGDLYTVGITSTSLLTNFQSSVSYEPAKRL